MNKTRTKDTTPVRDFIIYSLLVDLRFPAIRPSLVGEAKTEVRKKRARRAISFRGAIAGRAISAQGALPALARNVARQRGSGNQ